MASHRVSPPKICIRCVRVKINKRSFEPFCVLIPEDFSGSYCLLSFECLYGSLVDDSSNGFWMPWFGLLNCNSSVYI